MDSERQAMSPLEDPDYIPYSRQSISEEDIQAVTNTLRSAMLTTGPMVDRFEQDMSNRLKVAHSVAVNSGTTGLLAAMAALEIRQGQEVIVPALTFAATATCVAFHGATPVFSDVDPGTLLIDAEKAARCISPDTKAIIAVDYAGQPCDYEALKALADAHGLQIVADACHSLGASLRGRPVGGLADLTVFSFHPVKAITTGEGGMVTSDSDSLALKARRFINHGISSPASERHRKQSYHYDINSFGINGRLTDIQSALGISQLKHLSAFIAKRQIIAHRYDKAFQRIKTIEPLGHFTDRTHAYHLYVCRIKPPADRDRIFALMRERHVGVNVHYPPIHLHPYYRGQYGSYPGMCPVAEHAYQEILSLPIHPTLTDSQLDQCIELMVALCT